MLNGMIVEPVDNVVVAIEPVKKGETVTYMCAGEEKRLTAAEDITIYHKLAACDIAKGQPIVKYGEHIGLAARDIKILAERFPELVYPPNLFQRY